MRVVDYADAEGRNWRVRVPDDCPEDLYPSGIIIGPPAGIDGWLQERGWAEKSRVQLHNELHARGLLTLKDVLARPREIEAAIKAVLRTDVQGIQAAYYAEAGGK